MNAEKQRIIFFFIFSKTYSEKKMFEISKMFLNTEQKKKTKKQISDAV